MRSVIQRVAKASVTIDDVVKAQIDRGLLVLLAITLISLAMQPLSAAAALRAYLR